MCLKKYSVRENNKFPKTAIMATLLDRVSFQLENTNFFTWSLPLAMHFNSCVILTRLWISSQITNLSKFAWKPGSCPYSRSPLFIIPILFKRRNWCITTWHMSLLISDQGWTKCQTALGTPAPDFEYKIFSSPRPVVQPIQSIL